MGVPVAGLLDGHFPLRGVPVSHWGRGRLPVHGRQDDGPRELRVQSQAGPGARGCAGALSNALVLPRGFGTE